MPPSPLALNTAIEAIYEAALAPETWPRALTAVSACFNAEGTLLFFQRADGSYAAINSPGAMEEVSRRFVEEDWTRRDLRAIRAQEHGAFGKRAVVTDQDIVTPEEIETHPYYTDLLGPHGLAWCMAASVSPCPDTFVALSVQRLKAMPFFSEHDRTGLEILGRHAERALRLSTRILQAELESVVLGDALEHLGCGVVLVNNCGHAVFYNHAAKDLLADLPPDHDGVLIGPDSPLDPALREQITNVLAMPYGAEPETGRPVIMASQAGNPPTVAYVMPVAASSRADLAAFDANVSAIVLLIAQNPLDPVDPAIVRDILGLTLGEARVASLIGAGRSQRDTAAAIGISEETVLAVLNRVYAKTSLSRESHLASVLTRMTLRPAAGADGAGELAKLR